MDEYERRLIAEREYQNSRTRGELELHTKRRNKFYYLVNNARNYYDKVIIDNLMGKRVIVVGCAEGSVTPLARHGAKKVLGVDIANEAINNLNNSIEAEGLSDVAEAIVGNAENLEVPNGSYDIICCSGVLHHLDIKKAMESWRNALSKNGKVVMMEPMALNPFVYLYRKLTPSMRTVDEHPLLPRDIKLIKNYFVKVEVNGFVLTSLVSLVFAYLPNYFSLKENSYRVFEKIDRGLLNIFPALSYFCWTSVIKLESPIKE